MLSNSNDFGSAVWQNLTSNVNWELTSGDGLKTISAKFKDNQGNESNAFFSDEIVLDTRAEIDSFYLTSSESVFEPGETLHFVLETGESSGSAGVTIGGVETVTLFDNGS